MHSKYIDVMLDEAFKRVFSVEENMILLLNAVFKDRKIVSVTYEDKELFGWFTFGRRTVFDMYCKDDQGRHFIVEVQYRRQDNFINRSLVYSMYSLHKQVKRGKKYNYELTPVYLLALLDFVVEEFGEESFVHQFELRDNTTGELMTDKLKFIFIELPKFKASPNGKMTDEEKMVYFLKYSQHMDTRPDQFKDSVYDTLFETAEYEALTNKEKQKYDMLFWRNRDDRNADEYARKVAIKEGLAQGLAEGRAEGRAEGGKERSLEIAKNLVKLGIEDSKILEATGITQEQLNALK